tara:strand:- start:173 stop:322 length:150 start_codon:yes stop_codon:yes gene_type:complete
MTLSSLSIATGWLKSAQVIAERLIGGRAVLWSKAVNEGKAVMNWGKTVG